MDQTIRLLRPEEIDRLARFKDGIFGHARGFFARRHPDLMAMSPDCSLIMEENGQIIGHVGAYPMALRVGGDKVAGGVEFTCGGIGGVSTAPAARGRGVMSRLMKASIERMRERGWYLSVLWGDEQRYMNFGYRTAGLKYQLRVTRRSLDKAGITPSKTVEEVDASDGQVLAALGKFYPAIAYGVDRGRHLQKLRNYGVRTFVGEEGYLVSLKEMAGDLQITELVSPTGREAELIYGAMQLALAQAATVELAAVRTAETERLWRVANYWQIYPQGMFRIIDWPKLLMVLAPYLESRAAGLPPFVAVIGCRWEEDVERATVRWDGRKLEVSAGDKAASAGGGASPAGGQVVAVDLDNPHLTGLLLGGPLTREELPGPFARLLPVPVHIPQLDHV